MHEVLRTTALECRIGAGCPAGTTVSEDGTHCAPQVTTFYLQSPRSGLCVPVNRSQADTASMEQCGNESEVNGNPGMENGLGTSAWHCEPSGAFHTDQAWQLNGGLIVQKLSGRCLTVRGGQIESGAPLILYDCAEVQEANF